MWEYCLAFPTTFSCTTLRESENTDRFQSISTYLLISLLICLVEFERSLRKTLKEGDVDDITDKLTPRALTKCDTNALLMAMEVSSDSLFFEKRKTWTVLALGVLLSLGAAVVKCLVGWTDREVLSFRLCCQSLGSRRSQSLTIGNQFNRVQLSWAIQQSQAVFSLWVRLSSQ